MPDIINQTDISEKVYDVISALVTTSSVGAECHYEDLPSAPEHLPCINMSTLTGDPVVRRYQDGGKVLNYRFSLTLRQSNDETRERLDAVAILRELASKFCELPLDFGEDYSIWERAIDTLPCQITADDSYDDYLVTLHVTYRQ